MNDELLAFAKSTIKIGLEKCTDRQVELFKLMYGRKPNQRGDATRSVDDAKKLGIDAILKEMSPEQLDHGMIQVRNTIRKNKSQLDGFRG